MKIKILIMSCALITLSTIAVYAQDAVSTGNVFNQQRSKIRLMLQQIILLQTHLQAIKKGYNITSNGLNTAKQWKNGTFGLHQGYYSSLYQVNRAVSKDSKIQAIYDLGQQMQDAFERAISWQRQKALLNNAEIDYMVAIRQNVKKEIATNEQELKLVTTPGKVQMTDAERVDKIDRIYSGTEKQNAFTSAFINQAYVLANLRESGTAGDLVLNKLYQ